MAKCDQMFFPCDIRKFDWFNFRINYHLGLMKYIGLESLDHFDQARIKYKKLIYAHYIAIFAYYMFFGVVYYLLGRCLGINDCLINLYQMFKNGIGFE